MRRIRYLPFLFLLIVLVFGMSLPLRLTEGMRAQCLRLLSQSWQGFNLTSNREQEKVDALIVENQNLKAHLHSIREWLLSEERLEGLYDRYCEISEKQIESNFFRRRSQHLAFLLEKQYESLSAQVIFREPASWNTHVWINVGEKDNEVSEHPIIAKNSPVLVGNKLVGLVEEVKASQARVRLITDSKLCIAVRAVRGADHILACERIDELVRVLRLKSECREVVSALLELKSDFGSSSAIERYLAKGELHGSGDPLWRTRGHTLKGTGFNYDYADEEGPARPLRAAEEILRVGDLLITTGLDGVFPPDIPVAFVTKISTLREGACHYDLEADALMANMDELRYVTVLPPLSSEPL